MNAGTVKRKKKRFTKADVKKTKKSATGPPMCKLCNTAHWGRDGHKF